MVRIVKAPDVRRSEIIACAQQFFFAKGYDNTSVNDIVKTLGVAKGTFYHYFDSKGSLLEAVVDELVSAQLDTMKAVIADDSLDAIAKWQEIFQKIGSWKTARKEELIGILRVMRRDENIMLTHKIELETIRRTAPIFGQIITQGVAEGVFNTDYPEESAKIAFAIMRTFSEEFGALMLNPNVNEHLIMARVERNMDATQLAVERVLGAPAGSLPVVDKETLAKWFTAD